MVELMDTAATDTSLLFTLPQDLATGPSRDQGTPLGTSLSPRSQLMGQAAASLLQSTGFRTIPIGSSDGVGLRASPCSITERMTPGSTGRAAAAAAAGAAACGMEGTALAISAAAARGTPLVLAGSTRSSLSGDGPLSAAEEGAGEDLREAQHGHVALHEVTMELVEDPGTGRWVPPSLSPCGRVEPTRLMPLFESFRRG
jgi:hypothetical protein